MAGVMATVVLLQPAGERRDWAKWSCSCCMQFIELVLSWSVIVGRLFEMVSWLNLLVVTWEVLRLIFFQIQLTSKFWSDVDYKWCYFLLPNNSFRVRYQTVISFLWVNNFLLIKLETKFPLCLYYQLFLTLKNWMCRILFSWDLIFI
jgi:hypothetical protein